VRTRRSAIALALLLGAASAAQAAGHGSAAREFRALTTIDAAPANPGPLALVRVTVGQLGRDLAFSVRTARPWRIGDLARDRRRTICLLVSASSAAPPARQVCLRARRRTLSVELTPVGRPGRARALDAVVTRTDGRSFNARFDAGLAGIHGRRYAWRVESIWTGPGACAPTRSVPAPCTQLAPPSGAVAATLTPVRAIGCTRPRELFVTQGPARTRAVALTFDDGPSAYTASLLSVLERKHVAATFFLIGRQVAGDAALARRELRDGDVVGNHSWSHANLAGDGAFAAGQLRSTSAAIERATGFRTCLFRAPYGSVSGALEREAAAIGLTTIQWNVDPRDWSLPGTDAIFSRVVGAVRPGSIVIMHDGGGPRAQTVAAVPRIIDALRRRGYAFDTVPELLGQTVLYGR
jgi:peptidoglycan-N-acetylglucosamine deacetylase